MIIIRKHTGSFVVIPRATADDKRLSAAGLAALVYLMAQPTLGHVSTEDIQARFKIGKPRAEGLLNEPESFGYSEREWEPF